MGSSVSADGLICPLSKLGTVFCYRGQASFTKGTWCFFGPNGPSPSLTKLSGLVQKGVLSLKIRTRAPKKHSFLIMVKEYPLGAKD